MKQAKVVTSRGRQTKRPNYADDDFEDAIMPSSDTGRRRSGRPGRRDSFVVHDEEDEDDDRSEDDEADYGRSTRTRGRKQPSKSAVRAFPPRETRHSARAVSSVTTKPERTTRASRRVKIDPDDEEDYEDIHNTTMDVDADMELGADAVPEAEVLEKSPSPKFRSTPPDSESPPPMRNTARDRRLRASRRSAARDEDEDWAVEDEEESQPRQLRKRNKEVNYAIPPPLEDMPKSKDKGKGRAHSILAGLARGVGSAKGRPLIPWGATGRDLGKALGEGSSSDSVRFLTLMRSDLAGRAQNS